MDKQRAPAHTISHNGIGHHPLGAGSYYFHDDIVKWLTARTASEQINVFIGTQPNSSPHLGNLVNITLAFALGNRLAATSGRKVCVWLDYVDTAPAPQQDVEVDGVRYQRSLRWSGEAMEYACTFREIVTALSAQSGVGFVIRTQSTVMQGPHVADGIRYAIQHRQELAELFSPKSGCIGLRAACPHPDCGLADKAGVLNEYIQDRIVFSCPVHGKHHVDVGSATDMARLELNTPLRNLLRNYAFQLDEGADWIQVVGADYAGMYQEQFLWRPLGAMLDKKTAPLIVYSPQILDWSGAKLSKSLYVRGDAYDFLHDSGFGYTLSYDLYKSSGRKLGELLRVCMDWVDNPYNLFRSYTLYYLDALLREAGDRAGQPLQQDRADDDVIDERTVARGTSLLLDPCWKGSALEVTGKRYTHIAEKLDGVTSSTGPAYHLNSASSDWPSDDENTG